MSQVQKIFAETSSLKIQKQNLGQDHVRFNQVKEQNLQTIVEGSAVIFDEFQRSKFIEFWHKNWRVAQIACEEHSPISTSEIPVQFVRLTGFLTKEGGNRGRRRKRWFVLTDSSLSYFENKKSKKPISVIPTLNFQQVIPTCSEKEFQLLVPDRLFVFEAENTHEGKQWIKVLNAVKELNVQIQVNVQIIENLGNPNYFIKSITKKNYDVIQHFKTSQGAHNLFYYFFENEKFECINYLMNQDLIDTTDMQEIQKSYQKFMNWEMKDCLVLMKLFQKRNQELPMELINYWITKIPKVRDYEDQLAEIIIKDKRLIMEKLKEVEEMRKKLKKMRKENSQLVQILDENKTKLAELDSVLQANLNVQLEPQKREEKEKKEKKEKKKKEDKEFEEKQDNLNREMQKAISEKEEIQEEKKKLVEKIEDLNKKIQEQKSAKKKLKKKIEQKDNKIKKFKNEIVEKEEKIKKHQKEYLTKKQSYDQLVSKIEKTKKEDENRKHLEIEEEKKETQNLISANENLLKQLSTTQSKLANLQSFYREMIDQSKDTEVSQKEEARLPDSFVLSDENDLGAEEKISFSAHLKVMEKKKEEMQSQQMQIRNIMELNDFEKKKEKEHDSKKSNMMHYDIHKLTSTILDLISNAKVFIQKTKAIHSVLWNLEMKYSIEYALNEAINSINSLLFASRAAINFHENSQSFMFESIKNCESSFNDVMDIVREAVNFEENMSNKEEPITAKIIEVSKKVVKSINSLDQLKKKAEKFEKTVKQSDSYYGKQNIIFTNEIIKHFLDILNVSRESQSHWNKQISLRLSKQKEYISNIEDFSEKTQKLVVFVTQNVETVNMNGNSKQELSVKIEDLQKTCKKFIENGSEKIPENSSFKQHFDYLKKMMHETTNQLLSLNQLEKKDILLQSEVKKQPKLEQKKPQRKSPTQKQTNFQNLMADSENDKTKAEEIEAQALVLALEKELEFAKKEVEKYKPPQEKKTRSYY